MVAETLKIECTGYSVDADWYEGNSTDKILLALIGWGSNRSKYNDLLTSIVKNTGMSALVFDYSGLGSSKFDLSTTRPAQHFLEVIHVFDWLKTHYPNSKLSVMGTSYGGFMATQLTKYRTFEKLVLRVPAIYKPEDFYTYNKDIHNEWVRSTYRNDAEALAVHPLLARVSEFKGKTLVVVHENDIDVPKPTTNAYIKAFGSDTYLAEGFPHRVGGVPREQIVTYQNAISDWLGKDSV